MRVETFKRDYSSRPELTLALDASAELSELAARQAISRKRPDYALDQGGTGYGVRLIVELAQRYSA